MTAAFAVDKSVRNFEIASAVLEGEGYKNAAKRFGLDDEDVRLRTFRYCLQVNPALWQRLAFKNPDGRGRQPRMEDLKAHKIGFLPYPELVTKPALPAETLMGWFGVEDPRELLVREPGRLLALSDKPFRVIAPWSTLGLLHVEAGVYEMDFWPVGTEGFTVAVCFESQEGWQIEITLPDWDKIPNGFEVIKVSLRDFLRCTAPIEQGRHA